MTPEQLVARVFGMHVSEVGDDSSNRTVDGWDSLGHVTLIMELESAYGVSLSTEDALALTSVGAIKRFLESKSVSW